MCGQLPAGGQVLHAHVLHGWRELPPRGLVHKAVLHFRRLTPRLVHKAVLHIRRLTGLGRFMGGNGVGWVVAQRHLHVRQEGALLLRVGGGRARS